MISLLEHKRRIWRKASARYRERHPNALREWQKANREKCRAYSRKWLANNPEKAKQQNMHYRTVNRANYLALRRTWNTTNRDKRRKYNLSRSDKLKASAKEFYRSHRERWNHYKQIRRAREANTEVSKNSKAINRIYARARELRQWFDVCVDHIVPLSKGGHHAPRNLQIIYKFENLIKFRRLDYKPRVVFR